MSERKYIYLLFVVFVLGALTQSALSQSAEVQYRDGVVFAAGVPEEFRWTLFVRDQQVPTNSDLKDAGGVLIARYVSRPVSPGDVVNPGDYPVDEKYLLRIPDKEGTLVVKFPTKIIYRTAALLPDPFTDERTPVAVIVDGKTLTVWINARFDEEARFVPDIRRDLAKQKLEANTQAQ